jgi:hypothetical protein
MSGTNTPANRKSLSPNVGTRGFCEPQVGRFRRTIFPYHGIGSRRQIKMFISHTSDVEPMNQSIDWSHTFRTLISFRDGAHADRPCVV